MARKSFLLRIDERLYQEIEALAQQEMRSVNGQIEYLLHQAALKVRGPGQRTVQSDQANKSTQDKP